VSPNDQCWIAGEQEWFIDAMLSFHSRAQEQPRLEEGAETKILRELERYNLIEGVNGSVFSDNQSENIAN